MTTAAHVTTPPDREALPSGYTREAAAIPESRIATDQAISRRAARSAAPTAAAAQLPAPRAIGSSLESSTRDVRSAENRLDELEAVARMGSYSLEFATGQWTSSTGFDTILGIDAAFDRSISGWASLVHPDDRTVVLAYLSDEVIAYARPFDLQYRIVRAEDGAERWVHWRGVLELDDAGRPARLVGTVADITEQHLASEALAASELRYAVAAHAWAVPMDTMASEARPPLPGIRERETARPLGSSQDVADRVRDALAVGGLRPVFQPVVHLASGRPVGYEALTAFTSGEAPDQLIAAAHTVGLGLDLESACLTAALQAAKTLPKDAWVSLNVSPDLILETDRLAGILGSGSRRIVLEITEHARINDYEAVRRAVVRLGPTISLAVDDAGAGFASLRHIIELRPRYLKLDMSLVHHVDRDAIRQAMVAAMRQFSARTACEVIAEGIEEPGELAMLREMGLPFGQGFLLGRPRAAMSAPTAA
jgi:PAS domain S-box-containing protein